MRGSSPIQNDHLASSIPPSTLPLSFSQRSGASSLILILILKLIRTHSHSLETVSTHHNPHSIGAETNTFSTRTHRWFYRWTILALSSCFLFAAYFADVMIGSTAPLLSALSPLHLHLCLLVSCCSHHRLLLHHCVVLDTSLGAQSPRQALVPSKWEC